MVGCAQNSSSKRLNSDFLVALRLSSPRNRAGDVLAVGATKPKLSTCGHVWCPAVAWTHPGLVGPHKEPATKGRALLPSLLLHLLFASYGSSTRANPTAWWKSGPAALRSMLHFFPIAPRSETPTPDISVTGMKWGALVAVL